MEFDRCNKLTLLWPLDRTIYFTGVLQEGSYLLTRDHLHAKKLEESAWPHAINKALMDPSQPPSLVSPDEKLQSSTPGQHSLNSTHVSFYCSHPSATH